MIKIGITGGIGSGKTYVSDLIKKQGLPVFNCDQAAKFIMANEESVRTQLIALIGDELFAADGKMNKDVMSAFIFANEEKRQKVNDIVHPAVKEQYQRWLSVQYTPMVFMESAILFESGFSELVDKIIHVYAAEDVRLHRIIQRDHLTRIQATERMKSQMSEAVKMKLSDFCILNNGNLSLTSQVNRILSQLDNQTGY